VIIIFGFINYFSLGWEGLFGWQKMRGCGRAMIAAGVVFCVLGTLLFFVSERVTVQVGLMPFSFMLIFVLVAGVIMFGSGLLLFVMDRYWNA
jgi:hypothetical protein